MVVSPPDFGGRRLRILPDRRRGAGIAERQRLRALDRAGGLAPLLAAP